MPPAVSLRGLSSLLPAGSGNTSGTAASATVSSAFTPLVAATTSDSALSALSAQGNASLLCNLLPSLGQPGQPNQAAGIYVGEGLLPVPAKLGERITRWEFIEMSELLPEFWSLLSPKDSGTTPNLKQGVQRRKRAVTDIATWVQCFATYISVMSTPHPEAVPELLAYLIFILRVSQDFGGVAWVTYDAAFRRQAFITGNRQWSKVNPSLYSICFTGVARTGQRCELCLSLSHPTVDCTLVSDPDPDITTRLKTLESAVLVFASQSPQQQLQNPRARPQDICRNFNLGRCRMSLCRFRHACRVCGGPNPAMACCDRRLGPRPMPSNATPPSPSPPVLADHRRGPGPHPLPSYPGPERLPRIRDGPRPY